MVNERGPIKMLIGNGSEGFSGEDLGFLLREQRKQESIDRDREREREHEVNMYRSGSCPPTVEGSLSAIEGIKNVSGLMNEEELRSDPAYLSYYYSNVNLNPRLPPPIMSKEDWRFSQRLQAVGSSKVGGIGDNRKTNSHNSNSKLLFSMQPGFNSKNEENEKVEWLDKEGDGLIGLSLGRQKSLADIFQDELSHSNPILGHPSRPSSRNAFDDNVEKSHSSSDAHLALHHDIGLSKVQTVSTSQTFASVLGSSLSRSNNPDPQLAARAPSPWFNNNENINNSVSSSVNRTSSGLMESDDLVAALSGMSLSSAALIDEDIIAQTKLQKEMEEHQNFLFGMQGSQYLLSNSQSVKNSYPDFARNSGNGPTLSPANSRSKSTASASFVGSPSGYPAHYQNMNSPNVTFSSYGPSGYSIDPASPSFLTNHNGVNNYPPLFDNSVAASRTGSTSIEFRPQNLNKIRNFHVPPVDPLYVDYLRNFGNPLADTGYMGNSYLDLLATQKQYLGALLPPQKNTSMPFLGKNLNHGYYGNPAFGLGMTYPANPVLSGSPGGPGSPLRLGERSMRFGSGIRNLGGSVMGSWHSDNGVNMNDSFVSSLLEEFKSNKTKSYELSDIVGHVVEFSADQYGSRFIQQKLETATTEEKDMIYAEIMPHAFSLMTDVFGNYVIQKFFDHGSAAQRRELADQLNGHVLTLSLQMYGCRVIQKAIEVVNLDQQTKMVAELDGHIMRCVRDQNGNHVIQKCIECIPQDAIQFIVSSFYDQVVTLSTHPYGCRVIQRMLEHCDDPKTQQIVMDEIFQCVCMLAQDQYGNYVVQHVLEHGKPHERSTIITKLAGQIVQMSQQKFASNVVEKCLAFGGPVERQILVNEMLGTTDENEPLQAMMKDQFANYVVQKVLETCDDQQRELILSRIKVHLNALKKYTYGKHIVARVEKLVAAGERRIGIQPSYIS